ncbi:MAG: hypothetical protein V4793_01610 [Paraburkholderia tropica]
MKGIQRAFYVLAGIVGVLLLSYYGATSVGSKPYDPSLMASWVQAVGSIAAIVGAIWVAFRQDFKEQDAKRQAAVITASGMNFRLQDNLDDLDSLIKEFEKMSKIDFNPMNLHRFADRLSELRKWSSDEEVTLIALGGDCSVNLAAARDRLHAAPQIIQDFFVSDGVADNRRRLAFAAKTAKHLEAAWDHLSSAITVCELSTATLRKQKV